VEASIIARHYFEQELSETPTKLYAKLTAIVGKKVAASANWRKNPARQDMHCSPDSPPETIAAATARHAGLLSKPSPKILRSGS
jgi:hypothetical protein